MMLTLYIILKQKEINIVKYRKIVVIEKGQVSLVSEKGTFAIQSPHEIICRNLISHVSAGTELACIMGWEDWFNIPGTPGYTSVAEIVETGDAVEAFVKGDIVLCFGPHAEKFKINITDRWSGLCVRLPLGISLERASLAHMASIAMTAIRVSDIEIGDTVAVSGLGAIGNLAGQLARLQGAGVLGLDIRQSRLSIAKECGLEFCINTKEQNMTDAVLQFTSKTGVSTFIEASGHSGVTAEAIACISRYGELIVLGSPRNSFYTDLTPFLQGIHLWDKGSVRVKGALEFIYPTQPIEFVKHSIERNMIIILDLIQKGSLLVDPLISHVVDPKDAQSAYLGLMHQPDEYIGVLFKW